MKPMHASPGRSGADLARFEAIDGSFLGWARAIAAEEVQFPVLIDQAALECAEYPSAFPHLLMSACACLDPARPLPGLLAGANLAPTGWLLSPAVCYHAYLRWQNEVVEIPRILTARGRCFRKEAELSLGRRQIEFEMREIVFCGAEHWIGARLAEAEERVNLIARSLRVTGEWEIAADPFFLPTAQGKALMQRLQETKREFVTKDPAPLAIVSINRHGTFFGERFALSLPDGQPAHTACVAFGLDRWERAAKAGPA